MTTITKPIIFLVGATGQTGKLILDELDRGPDDVHVRLGVRSQADIDRLRADGRDAVHFDLDDPRTFGMALAGVDRLYLLTGYTVAMTHQSKTLIDAAKKAGVRHIVNQGVFAEWDCTDPTSPGSGWSNATRRRAASPGRIFIQTCSWNI